MADALAQYRDFLLDRKAALIKQLASDGNAGPQSRIRDLAVVLGEIAACQAAIQGRDGAAASFTPGRDIDRGLRRF